MLKKGTQASNFSLPDQTGKLLSFMDFAGHGIVALRRDAAMAAHRTWCEYTILNPGKCSRRIEFDFFITG